MFVLRLNRLFVRCGRGLRLLLQEVVTGFFVLADIIMNKLNVAAIAVLLMSVMLIGAQSRNTVGTVDVATIEAMEHQRILAELEEVHQLRERMLQQGTLVFGYTLHKCCAAMQRALKDNT